jgi:hypothetical protein
MAGGGGCGSAGENEEGSSEPLGVLLYGEEGERVLRPEAMAINGQGGGFTTFKREGALD